MRVTVGSLEAMARRQDLLVAEFQAGRESPGSVPLLGTPVRIAGARTRPDRADDYAGLSDTDWVPPGPAQRYGVCSFHVVRTDRDALPFLSHVMAHAGGTTEVARACAKRLVRFAELKIASINAPRGVQPRRQRGGQGIG